MKIILYGMEHEVHDKSPMLGDIVRCTNKERHLVDPYGYQVENLGVKGGYGTPFGTFTARGIRDGGLYLLSVDEYTGEVYM